MRVIRKLWRISCELLKLKKPIALTSQPIEPIANPDGNFGCGEVTINFGTALEIERINAFTTEHDSPTTTRKPALTASPAIFGAQILRR
jgi:hypothetical protein